MKTHGFSGGDLITDANGEGKGVIIGFKNFRSGGTDAITLWRTREQTLIRHLNTGGLEILVGEGMYAVTKC